MERENKRDLSDTGRGLLVETVLDVGSEALGDAVKEHISSTILDILVDSASSFIPGLSGAVAGYKRARFERNITVFSNELVSKIDEIRSNLEKKTEAQRKELDKLFTYVMDYVIEEPQEEKIEFMVNGFVSLTEHEQITDDFVLTYYDVLRELRMVDLSVLRLMYSSAYFLGEDENRETYLDIMERHGLSYEQYESVRRNIQRLGLLNTKADINIVKDLKEITSSFKELYKYLEKLTNPKHNGRLPKLKEPKLKSTDNLQITKFGRDFVGFFMALNRDETEPSIDENL